MTQDAPKPATTSSPAAGIIRRRALSGPVIIACLTLLVLAAFSPVRHAGFLSFDDPDYVTDNPRVRGGLTSEGLRWAFTFHSYNWHPLTWLSHMLDVRLFGLDPRGHHLVSLLLHLGNTLLLFFLLRSMTGVIAASAFTAALFAVHPLHVESVAWVSERKDVLSTFFWFLTMALYLRYLRKPGTGRYLVAALTYTLGLMAKPMLVSLPFILLLIDWWPLGRFGHSVSGQMSCHPWPLGRLGRPVFGQMSLHPWPLWRRSAMPARPPAPSVGRGPAEARLPSFIFEKIPFLLLASAAAAATYRAQAGGGALNLWAARSPWLRAANALVSYARYLVKTLWPEGLAVYYPLPDSPPVPQAILALILLGPVTILAILARRRSPWVMAGWLWYLATLVPVIGLVQVGSQAMADRYTYLPLVGLFMAAAWSAAAVAARSTLRRLVITAPAVALVLLLTCLAHRQARLWQNDLTLFGHATAVTRDNWMAHSVLGYVLLEQDRPAEAAAHYREVLRINPGYVQAHNNLGNALAKLGDIQGALEHYRSAVRLKPDYEVGRLNLANQLLAMGFVDEGMSQYREVLRLRPDNPEGHNDFGAALLSRGRPAEAEGHFREAVRLKPYYADAWFNLGSALEARGRTDEAARAFTEALRLR